MLTFLIWEDMLQSGSSGRDEEYAYGERVSPWWGLRQRPQEAASQTPDTGNSAIPWAVAMDGAVFEV